VNDVVDNMGNAVPKTNFIGARAELGLPLIRVAAGAGIFDPNVAGADKEVAFSGMAALQVFGGPLIPISIRTFAGAGYLKAGSATTINVPVGVALAVNVPTPGFSIDPWVAPRLHLTRTSNGTSDTNVNLAASAGVNLALPIGLGVHLAADYVVRSTDITGLTSSDVSPLLIGVGVHYTISIPGLGIPIVPIM
jgi:hypothetical protein